MQQLYKHTFRSKWLVWLFVVSLNSYAQVKYPTDSSFINVLSNASKNNLSNFSYDKIDTSINHFQNYYTRNTNGNIGLPSTPFQLKYQSKPLGFNLYHAPYDNDMIQEDKVVYYQTKGPYASLTGIAGSKQEQLFRFLFSNTFRNKLNLTLAFNRYGALGFYKRQQTFTNNFYTSSNYTSPNKRVGYYAYFLFNKVKHLENGGVSNDTLFERNRLVTKQLLPVYLSGAKREVRYTTFDINPWFRLNKTEDSASAFTHILSYQLNYSGNYTKYTDPGIAQDNYYNVFYLDTTATKDSTHWRKISNAVNYLIKINPLHTQFQVGFKNEYNQVHQYSDSAFINSSANAGAYFTHNHYNGFVKADYIFAGANVNDYSIEMNNSYITKLGYSILKSPLQFSLNGHSEQRHPDFIYNRWFSNHYAWSNSFVPVQKQQILFKVSTVNNRFDMGILYQSIQNQLYFNEQAIPAQTTIPIHNMSLWIHKDILLFKHLGINAQYNYQTSSYQAIMSIPNHVVNSALYYQGNLFKNALQLQVGFNVQYYSQFKSYVYMPATNVYYVQTKTEVGDYPYLDFFINARIKPVRIFVKIDHVSQGLVDANYSLIPGYIQNDRAFKFGINWLFFD